MHQNEQKLKKIFSKILEISENDVNDNIQYNNIKNWDSIGHMAIVAALEEEFNVIFDTEDIIEMSSIHKVKEILIKYHVDFSL